MSEQYWQGYRQWILFFMLAVFMAFVAWVEDFPVGRHWITMLAWALVIVVGTGLIGGLFAGFIERRLMQSSDQFALENREYKKELRKAGIRVRKPEEIEQAVKLLLSDSASLSKAVGADNVVQETVPKEAHERLLLENENLRKQLQELQEQEQERKRAKAQVAAERREERNRVAEARAEEQQLARKDKEQMRRTFAALLRGLIRGIQDAGVKPVSSGTLALVMLSPEELFAQLDASSQALIQLKQDGEFAQKHLSEDLNAAKKLIEAQDAELLELRKNLEVLQAQVQDLRHRNTQAMEANAAWVREGARLKGIIEGLRAKMVEMLTNAKVLLAAGVALARQKSSDLDFVFKDGVGINQPLEMGFEADVAEEHRDFLNRGFHELRLGIRAILTFSRGILEQPNSVRRDWAMIWSAHSKAMAELCQALAHDNWEEATQKLFSPAYAGDVSRCIGAELAAWANNQAASAAAQEALPPPSVRGLLERGENGSSTITPRGKKGGGRSNRERRH